MSYDRWHSLDELIPHVAVRLPRKCVPGRDYAQQMFLAEVRAFYPYSRVATALRQESVQK